eukprot:5683209-Amphidinium_carterae.2
MFARALAVFLFREPSDQFMLALVFTDGRPDCSSQEALDRPRATGGLSGCCRWQTHTSPQTRSTH